MQTQTDPAAAGNVLDTDPKGGHVGEDGLDGHPAGQRRARPRSPCPTWSARTRRRRRQTLTGAGFVVQTTQQNSDTVATGQVISQNPSANAQAAKGSTVTLTVSSGKAQVTIPDETGKDPATAANDLGNLSLKTKTAFEASDTIPSGAVTRTDPPANSQVARGSTVTIYESTGPSQVAVPSVIGQTQSQATATLQAGRIQGLSDHRGHHRPDSGRPGHQPEPERGHQGRRRASTVTIVIGVFTAAADHDVRPRRPATTTTT